MIDGSGDSIQHAGLHRLAGFQLPECTTDQIVILCALLKPAQSLVESEHLGVGTGISSGMGGQRSPHRQGDRNSDAHSVNQDAQCDPESVL